MSGESGTEAEAEEDALHPPASGLPNTTTTSGAAMSRAVLTRGFTDEYSSNSLGSGSFSSSSYDDASSMSLSMPSWMAGLGAPFQLPGIFPYHEPTGFSVQQRRLSGSTIRTTSTVPSKKEGGKSFEQRLDELHILELLESLYRRQLQRPRPRVRRRQRFRGLGEKNTGTTNNTNRMMPSSHIMDPVKAEMDKNSKENKLKHILWDLPSDTTTDRQIELQQEIAEVALSLGDLKRAEIALAQKIRLQKESGISRSKSLATDYLLWGDIRTELGTYKAAMDDLFLALDIRKEIFGSSHASVAECYFSLGHRFRVQGLYKQALEYLQEARKILRQQEDRDVNRMGDALHEMGLVLVEQEELDRGLENFEESLSSREDFFLPLQELSSRDSDGNSQDEEAEKVCMAALEIASIHNKMGKPALAGEVLEDILPQIKVSLGDQHPCLADIMIARADYQEASQSVLSLYEEALEIRRLHLPDTHELVQDIFVGLADTFVRLGDTSQAKKFYEKISEESDRSANRSPETQEYLFLKRALLAFFDGEISTALAVFSRYFSMLEQRGPTDIATEEKFLALLCTGVCYYLNGDKVLAKKWYKKAHHILKELDLFHSDPTVIKALKKSQGKVTQIKLMDAYGQAKERMKRAVMMKEKSREIGTWFTYYYADTDPLSKPEGWHRFPDEASASIEQAYLDYVAAKRTESLSKVIIHIGPILTEYSINLQTMRQHNTTTGTERPIQRVVNGLTPTSPPDAFAGLR